MSETELIPGQVLGRYELLMPIAKGGMARVWAARLIGSRGFRKIVAIKTILEGSMDDTRMERMFLDEAALASQIRHPNVVETLELGEHEGTLYLVMEWVDGEPLHHIVAQAAPHGGIPLSIAINIIGQACKGLHAAHDLQDDNGAPLGVVHRDISPQNLLVGFSGTTKLVDFGIAKVTARCSSLTDAGEVKGKFAYMSPEQVCGAPIDRRSDIFALGVLLYMLTTGRHPFKGEHAGETLRNISSDKPAAAPSTYVPDFPEALEFVLMKALSKNPDDRFATANEMLWALEQAMPEALEGSYEVKVAEYLNQLLGHRAGDRRQQIRLAEQRFNRGRPDMTIGPGMTFSSGMSGSGSLGAVAVALDGPASSGTMTVGAATTTPGFSAAVPIAPVNPAPAAKTFTVPPPFRTRRSWGWVAAAVSTSALAAVLVWPRLSSLHASHAVAAISHPMPAVTLSAAEPPPPVEVTHIPPPTAALTIEVPAALPATALAEIDAHTPILPERRARRRPATRQSTVTVAAPAAPVVAAAPAEAAKLATPPLPQPPAVPEAAPPSPKVDAWDPATFGGRR